MLFLAKTGAVFFDRGNEASRAVDCRFASLRMGTVCFLPEDDDFCQAISLSRACGVKRRRFTDDHPPRFDQPGGDEMSRTDATDLLIRSQNQTEPINQR